MTVVTGGGGALVSEVGYHPRKKIHVIRVVFQDQAMYARTSCKGANTCRIGKKGYVFGHIDKFWKGHDIQIEKNACKNAYLGSIFVPEKYKVLGIFLSYDEKLAISLNFDDKIRSLKQVLALWKNRDLTVIGKILIIKTFGLSKFLYVSNMISTPISVQKQINSIVHQFIWNGPDKIKRCVLSADYENGGLKMVDIVTKIKTQQIMWLKRFIDGNETVWKLILDQYLKRVGGLTFLLKCNFDIKKLKCHIPPFMKIS